MLRLLAVTWVHGYWTEGWSVRIYCEDSRRLIVVIFVSDSVGTHGNIYNDAEKCDRFEQP